jgi:hypothetical protein
VFDICWIACQIFPDRCHVNKRALVSSLHPLGSPLIYLFALIRIQSFSLMGNADSQLIDRTARRQHTPTETRQNSSHRKRRSLSPIQRKEERSDSLQIIQIRFVKTDNVIISSPTTFRTQIVCSSVVQQSSASFHSNGNANGADLHEAAKKRIQQRRAKSFRTPRR